MELLLDILREPSPTEPGRRAEVLEWGCAINLAREHQMLPWVAARVLDGSHGQLPVGIEEQLREARRSATIAGFLWSSELKGLLGEFAKASVPVLALKGPWFAQRVYGDAALRSCRDIDLLVRKEHFSAAERLLQDCGFTAQARADDYHRAWERGTIVVELHFDVENPLAFDFDMEGVWRRAREADFEGQPGWMLAPGDELLFLCLHGARHRFDRMSRVLDISLMLHRMSCSGEDFAEDMLLAGRKRLSPLLELGCELALRLQPGRESSTCGRAVPSGHMFRVALGRWESLINGPRGPRLDWRGQHRFYMEIESTRGRRLRRGIRHLCILARRTIQEDYDFSASFGVRASSMVWAARQLRLGVQMARFLPNRNKL